MFHQIRHYLSTVYSEMNMRLFFVFIVIFWGIFFKLGPYEERTVFFFSFPLPHSTYRRRSISYFNSNKKCMGMLPSVKQGHHVHHVCSLLWLFVLSRVYLGGRHSDQITHILLYSQNCRFSLFFTRIHGFGPAIATTRENVKAQRV